MVKRGGERYTCRRKNSDRPTSSAKLNLVAPTSGHKDVYFNPGSTKDTTAFQNTVQKLAQHVSIAAGWKQGPRFGKEMTDLKEPVFDQPTRPVRMNYDNQDNTETKVWATNGKRTARSWMTSTT